MKNYLIVILAIMLLGFWSCSDDDIGPFISNLTAPQITAPSTGTSFVLLEENAGNELAMATWNGADYGFDAAVEYKIQIDKIGNEFATPQNLGTTTKTSASINTGVANNAFILLGLTPDFESMVEMRIVSKVNSNVDDLYSQAITLTVNPYLVEVDYPKLWVPGAHNGWSHTDTEVIFSPKDNSRYEGYLWFPEADTKFKYTPGPNWDSDWGDNEPIDGFLDPSPGSKDITAVGPAGLYKLNVNLLSLSHSYALTNWGLIGDATPGGWVNDTDMTYDMTERILTVTLDLTAGGKIKFRANDGWDIDLGDDDTNGTMEYGGADIPISESGNYTVTLNLSQALYSYKIVKN